MGQSSQHNEVDKSSVVTTSLCITGWVRQPLGMAGHRPYACHSATGKSGGEAGFNSCPIGVFHCPCVHLPVPHVCQMFRVLFIGCNLSARNLNISMQYVWVLEGQ